MKTIGICSVETGEIEMTTGYPDDGTPLSSFPVPSGKIAIEIPEKVDGDSHWYDDVAQEIVPYTVEQRQHKKAKNNSPSFKWIPRAGNWTDVRPLEKLKEDLRQNLKSKRDQVIEEGFTWDGSRFDSDIKVSQTRLLGLLVVAKNGMLPPQGQNWRLADNTWRTLSSTDVEAVWETFQGKLSAAFDAFAVHESAIAAENNIESLKSYNVNSGWPL